MSSPSAEFPAAANEGSLPRPVRDARGRFRNPGRHENRTWLDVLRWKLGLGPRKANESTANYDQRRGGAFVPTAEKTSADNPDLSATWIGHSTFLIRAGELRLLTDPVWSERIGPAGLPGYRRLLPPALDLTDLPQIDAVLLSHDHYDHCDLPTLRRIAAAHPGCIMYCPLGYKSLARRAGFAGSRAVELDWWKSHELAPGAKLTATPARHWSNRLSGARNGRLWCGWYLDEPRTGSVFFAGDTAWDETMFAAIRRALGAPDLALLPIGAYAPRWFMRAQHCNPDEAVRIHLALGSRRSVAMHWGTFALTDEPSDEPPRRLAAAVADQHLTPKEFTAPPAGATIHAPARNSNFSLHR